MKKKILTILMAGMMLLPAGCGQKEPEIPSVLDDGVLVVGLLDTEDRSCFRTLDANGDPYYAGWEPQILTLLDEKMEEVTLEYRFAKTQDELITWLNTGEIELAAGSFTRLETLGQQYLLSDDYGYGSLYLVNKRNGYLDTMAGFTDEAVGISSRIPVNDIADIKGIETVVQNVYGDVATMGTDITNGVIAAGVCTETEAVYLMDHTDLQVIEMRKSPDVAMVFLMPVGQSSLLKWTNYAIDLNFYNIAMGITGDEEETQSGGGE